MISYEQLLNSITKMLRDKFGDNTDVIVDDTIGIFENECFYVSLILLDTIITNRMVDEKPVIISIKYFGGDKIKCYNLANELHSLYNRTIKIKDSNRVLKISKTEPNIYKDNIGYILDFLIYTSIFDVVVKDEEYELMKDLDIVVKNEI